MTDKPKIKWKLNLFDLGLIAVVLLAAALFVAIRSADAPSPSTSGAAPSPTAQSVRYVVQLEQSLPQTADMVEVGHHLYERTKKQDLGVVESIEITPARTLTKNELNGTFDFAEVPDRCDITMTLSSTATIQPAAIVLDSGLEIRAGSAVRVLGPGYYGSGYILSVERG